MTTGRKYYTSIGLQSYNAVFNFVISNRNYGKTWSMQKRAFKRGIKHGKRTLWVRRFHAESKQAIDKLYKSPDLLQFIGAEIYDKETKQGNLKQNGRKFYCRRGNKWYCFLEVIALCDSRSMRSADDVNIDTIVFDEFTTTPDKYKLYRGDEVTDFIDLFISIKREHEVKVFLFGNKESVNNPYFNYFGIKPLPQEYQGIRTFKGGSIAIQQINNKQRNTTQYENKVNNLLNGTKYQSYLNNAYKNATDVPIRKLPAYATLYLQVDIDNYAVRIMTNGTYFFVTSKLDDTKPVYCDSIKGKYKNERVLLQRNKILLKGLVNSYAMNKVSYTDLASYESFRMFLNWLNI